MNFKDHWVTDSEGREFIFTVEMQRKLSEAGLPVDPDNVSQLEHERPPSNTKKASPPAAPAQEEEEGPDTIQIDPMTGKYLGRLKWFNPAKGYGFIARGGGEDIFFHKTSIAGDANADDFRDGVWVLYDVEERRKGLEAAEVELYSGDLVS